MTSHTPDAVTTKAIKAVFDDPSVQSSRLVAQPGQAIYEPAGAAENIYFIITGQVRLFQTRGTVGRLMAILGPGEWFGCTALARGVARIEHRAITAAPTLLLRANADRFLQALPRHPAAAVEFSRSLARKVITAHEEAAGLIFDDCTARLIRAMLRFSSTPAAHRTPDGVVLHVTHEQLAQAIGVARETVSLTLTQFRQQNLIRTGRNRLTFDPAALAEYLRTRADEDTCTPVGEF